MARNSYAVVPEAAGVSSSPVGILMLPLAMLLTALAAGAGWGIRGQYGHETGAMISGSLAAVTLVMLFVPYSVSLSGFRAAAMMAAAIGIGGSMTYGQTVGLTHDHELVGNVAAWRWGMLGLALKGGVWIGFGGLFLGMGLGGQRYRAGEVAGLLLAALGLYILGVWLINSPFHPLPQDPADRQLPFLYFSDHWDFEPDKYAAGNMKPRFESFGGYWLALIGLAVYTRLIRGDRLALRMMLFGVLGGALGFSGGQCVQSAHAWHPEWFQDGGWLEAGATVFSRLNWWNVMETTFGLIWGAVMALGLWCSRHLIRVPHQEDRVFLPAATELLLLVLYVTFVLAGDFGYFNPDRLPVFQTRFAETHTLEFVAWWYVEVGLVLVTLPMIGIAGGRLWPYLMLTTVVAIPICAKTLRAVGYGSQPLWDLGHAWYYLVHLPVGLGLVLAAWLIQCSHRHSTGRAAAATLVFIAVLYVTLNSTFWREWPVGSTVELDRTNPIHLFNLTAAALLTSAAALTLLFRPGVAASRALSDSGR